MRNPNPWGSMAAAYCEVVLPLPLRSTFTYAVPGPLAEVVVPGSRVVVPFQNRALVGVVLGLTGSTTCIDVRLCRCAEIVASNLPKES